MDALARRPASFPLPHGVGRGRGVGRGLGVGEHLPTHGVGVGVGVGVGPRCAQYLPPVPVAAVLIISPPQISISLPVQTAVGTIRAAGTLAVLVAVHPSVTGSYLPPVFNQ